MLRTTSGFSSGGVYLPRTGKSRDSGQNDTRSKTFEGGIFFCQSMFRMPLCDIFIFQVLILPRIPYLH